MRVAPGMRAEINKLGQGTNATRCAHPDATAETARWEPAERRESREISNGTPMADIELVKDIGTLMQPRTNAERLSLVTF